MGKKYVYKRILAISFLFIFCITNVSYGVETIPIYTNDGTWVTISKDPLDNTKLKTDYDTNTYSDLITLIDHLISVGKYNIYLSDGEYDLNGTLNINNENVTILGQSKENTKLIEKDPDKNCIKVNANNFEMANCYIDNTIGYAVFHAQNVDGAKLENCIIRGSNRNEAISIYGNGTTMNKNTKIQGNTITSSFVHAIAFWNQNDGDVSVNNVFGGSIDFNECNNLIINNNNVKDSPSGGIRVRLPGENIKITNNTTENTHFSGIAVVADSSDNSRYTGIEIRDNKVTKTEYFGIEINNLDSGIISGNTISTIDFYGIYLLRSDKLIVDSNNISNCALYTGSSPIWGNAATVKSSIYLEAKVADSEIKNNVIHNDDANPCQYGIRVQPNNYNTNNTIWNSTITGPLAFTKYISADLFEDHTNIMQVTAITENSIKLQWEEISPTIQYEIQVQDENGNIIEPNPREAGSDESYTCTELKSGILYKFKIRVKDGSNWSNEVAAKTAPSLSLGQVTENSIEINWSGVSGATGYYIEVDGNATLIDGGTNTSYKFSGLPNNTSYTYRVRAKDENNWSNEVGATTLIPATKESPPTINIVSVTENSIKVEWTGVSGEAEYELEVDGNLIDVGKAESYVHNNLENNSNHKYKVRKKGGEWSNEVTETTHKTGPIELLPAIKIVSVTENSIKVEWTGASGEAEYELEVDGNLIDVGKTESYIHNNLKNNSTHKYKVRKKGGGWSNEVTATTLTKVPSITTPSAVTVITTSPGAMVTIRKRSKHSSNRSNKTLEFSFEDYKTLFYKENLIKDYYDDKLRRMLIYTLGRQYCFYLRAFQDNNLISEYKFKFNFVQEDLFTESEIKNISIDKNDKIDTILVRDVSNKLNDQEQNDFNEYSKVNEYVISLGDVGMKVQTSEKYLNDMN